MSKRANRQYNVRPSLTDLTQGANEERVENMQTYNASISDVTIDELVNVSFKRFEESEERKWMLMGSDYYNGKTDIDDKKRFTHAGTQGIEDSRLSNSKAKRNFMRKLTRQKKNYVFGKPFTLSTNDDNYRQLLEDEYFTKAFYKLVGKLGGEAIKQGINWLNVYYDEHGHLKYRRIPGDQVVPFWNDIEHNELNSLVHYYVMDVYVGNEVKEARFADYYSENGIIHYVHRDGKYVRDSERPYEEPHFVIDEVEYSNIEQDGEYIPKLDEDGNPIIVPVPYVWDRIPWVAFKYNEEESTLLKYIKNNQDIYEKLASVSADIILDIPDAIMYFKGYGGSDLKEVREGIAEHRAVIIDGDGDAGTIKTPYDVTATDATLNRLRKDVYEDGGGVDTQNMNVGDKSGVALKFLYSDLDLDSRDLITQFRDSLEDLMFFIDFDILLKHGMDYLEEEVTFNFDTSGIIDETEIIEQINMSTGFVPNDLLLAQHPFIEDVDDAKKLLEKERAEEEQRMEDMMSRAMYGNEQNNFNTNEEE